MQRAPAVERRINKLSESDKRVRIVGRIVEAEPSSGRLVVDDGTGSLTILFDNLSVVEKLANYKIGDNVLVIGIFNGGELNGEVIKRWGEYDPGLRTRVQSEWERIYGV